MKILFLLLLFAATHGAAQTDTLRILNDVSYLDRFWRLNRLDQKLDKGAKPPTAYYNINSYRIKLEGKDSTFSGIIAFCCENSTHGNHGEGITSIMYDETCSCKQYNVYKQGILISTEKNGDLDLGKKGIEKHIFDTDTSGIYLSMDLSRQLITKRLLFFSQKKQHDITTNSNGDTLRYSITYRSDENYYDSLISEKRSNHVRTGMIKNEQMDGEWKYVYDDQIKLYIKYFSGKVQDIRCESLIFYGLNGKVILKEVFLEQLKASSEKDQEEFNKNIEQYIIPIDYQINPNALERHLLISLPSETIQVDSPKAVQKILKDYNKLKKSK